jgi:diguanylate cyclase (GGDEF)-like protein
MIGNTRGGKKPATAGEADELASIPGASESTADRAGQTAADSDQTSSDRDQTSSDRDQGASEDDQADSDKDQRASDRDQETADRDRAKDPHRSSSEEKAYDDSRDERATVTGQRMETRSKRAHTARDRESTAGLRDRSADARDEIGRARDTRAAHLARGSTEPRTSLLKQLEELAAEAAADRERAAADRARAAADRAEAARERARLETELEQAHLDELTGAYRRELGHTAISHEIDRARRSDGRFVLAFVDVDALKAVNDRDGHAAGDRVLKSVVNEIRANLRSFDPIVRFGGDEFVCGLSGTDLVEAERRFEEIGTAIKAEVEVGISVGLTTLGPNDDVESLIERADAAMLVIKAQHHSRV